MTTPLRSTRDIDTDIRAATFALKSASGPDRADITTRISDLLDERSRADAPTEYREMLAALLA